MRSSGDALTRSTRAHAILNSWVFFSREIEKDDIGWLAHHRLVLVRPRVLFVRDYGEFNATVASEDVLFLKTISFSWDTPR